MSNKSDDTPQDGLTADVNSIHPTGHAALNIQSPLFHTEKLVRRDGEIENFGVRVLQDGTFMGLAAGSFEHGDDDWRVWTFHSLTPEQAREIADSLNEVADAVEEVELAQNEPEDEESFLRRLLR